MSPDEEFAHRRRRYLLMMLGRVVCFFGAVALVKVSVLLSVLLLIGGAVLPWCAVLLANDGPAKKRPTAQIGVMPHSQHELGGGPPPQDVL